MCSDIGTMWGQSALTHGTPDTGRPFVARRASTPAYVQLFQTAAVTSEHLHASLPELLATPKNWHSWGTTRAEKPLCAGWAAPQEAPNSVGPS